MKIHHLTPDEALASLDSRDTGLSSADVKRRLEEYGPNQVEQVRREPLWRSFARQFTHFFALILWFAAGLAFFADVYAPDQGMATLGVAILGVIMINGLFSFWPELRLRSRLSSASITLP